MIACRAARRQILRSADREPRPRVAAHVSGCLSCQAETARQRAVQRGLRALRDETVDAPADVVAAVMERLDRGVAPRRRRTLGWAAAGSAVVALVGAAALVGKRMRGAGAGA